METVAFLAGLFAFGLIKLVLVAAMPARGAAGRVAAPQRGDGLRMKELEAEVQPLEARLQAAEGEPGGGFGGRRERRLTPRGQAKPAGPRQVGATVA